jgi:hypothetical protein
MVTENVHMSRRWKPEFVAYGICKHPSQCLVHLTPIKPDRSPVCPVCPESFQQLVLIKNLVPIKPCIGIDRMSNQRKAEFMSGNFGIQCFLGGHGEILSKS